MSANLVPIIVTFAQRELARNAYPDSFLMAKVAANVQQDKELPMEIA